MSDNYTGTRPGKERDLTQRTTAPGLKRARITVESPAILLRDDEASVERLAAKVQEVFDAPGEDWGAVKGYYGEDARHFADMLIAALRGEA